uniref:hypothetical protein n=1 Tax=Gemmiger formicilis TaxID=745368 RepID=UPI00402A03B8
HMRCSFVRDLLPRAGRQARIIIWYFLIIPRGAALEKWAQRLFTHFLVCGQKTARSSRAYIGQRPQEYSHECIFCCRLQATRCGKLRINTSFCEYHGKNMNFSANFMQMEGWHLHEKGE